MGIGIVEAMFQLESRDFHNDSNYSEALCVVQNYIREKQAELETLKCLQDSDHHRAEKWVKIADELRKESEQRKDLVIQLENIIGIAYEASKEALGKN
jgi:hypothetical protein